MSEIAFNNRYYRLILDMLNAVYRDMGMDAQINHTIGRETNPQRDIDALT